MAASTVITSRRHGTIVRVASPEFDRLRELVFRRYPDEEWATFARFGWRETPGQLVLTLSSLDEPGAGDLDDTVGHVAIQEPYSYRIARGAEQHPLAVGVIHSHPKECIPRPSPIDDDMDSYYADYLSGFAPDRPYVSLILSKIDEEIVVSGRVHWREEWLSVERFAAERCPLRTWTGATRGRRDSDPEARLARLTAAFGREASERLKRASVAVIGAGGTGSAAIEVLARAGVGRLVIVDPDTIESSNLERVHGSRVDHVGATKVSVAREHVRAINPSCEVLALVGALPQGAVVDAVVTADMAIGCTDSHHSRLALSDLAARYLLPSLDCGVSLEGRGGRVTGQVGQIVRMLAADPCALCRALVEPQVMAQEMMTDEERAQRRAAAEEARAQGGDGNAYWRELPQLNTVGYLTTSVGAMVAGYAIGWVSGRFDPPFSRLQMNLVAPYLDVTDVDVAPRADCVCRRVRGWADQGAADALISAPAHWPRVETLRG